jgi:predicted RNA-binding protein YlqC (UPF0109 family)
MQDLLEFIVKGITGGTNFTIEENQENDVSQFLIKAKSPEIGIIIGKSGRTINAIRNLLKVKATLEKRRANVSITEMGSSE